jgi:hypothetical protein
VSTTFGRTDNIDIFNMISTHLSTGEITDAEFTTPTLKVTKAIKSVFRIARNSLLREHDWQFARVTTELISAPASVTLNGWDYFWYYPDLANLPTSGNKPQGSVYLRKVFTDTDSQIPEGIDFQIFNYFDPDNSIDGTFIATQEDDAYAVYTNYGYDEDGGATYSGVKSVNYDPIFSEVLAYKIAAMICKKVTGDKNLAKDLSALYNERLGKAKQHDQREIKSTDISLSTCDYIKER